MTPSFISNKKPQAHKQTAPGFFFLHITHRALQENQSQASDWGPMYKQKLNLVEENLAAGGPKMRKLVTNTASGGTNQRRVA
jgi:hypothetical protein